MDNHRTTVSARTFLLFLLIAGPSLPAVSQDHELSIVWWNVENLFDTVNDPDPSPAAGSDDEFTPAGARKWTKERYKTKLKNLGSLLGDILEKGYPDVVGLGEIENAGVVEDLITGHLPGASYKVAHHDSPDPRGIDVGFMYNDRVLSLRSLGFRTVAGASRPTRDVVYARFSGPRGEIVCIVNHWPSRRGGRQASEPDRIAAARTARALVDSLLRLNPNADIVIMGDFNDEPSDISLTRYLGSSGDSSAVRRSGTLLYNPFERESLESDAGTYRFRNQWDMLDQFLVSPGLLDAKGYRFSRAEIIRRDVLFQRDGRYSGYPFPTFGGQNYLGGYSDHLPILLLLKGGGDETGK